MMIILCYVIEDKIFTVVKNNSEQFENPVHLCKLSPVISVANHRYDIN